MASMATLHANHPLQMSVPVSRGWMDGISMQSEKFNPITTGMFQIIIHTSTGSVCLFACASNLVTLHTM